MLPSFEELKADKLELCQKFLYAVLQYRSIYRKTSGRAVSANICMSCRIRRQSRLHRWRWMISMQLSLYAEPIIRPMKKHGGVPAIQEVKFSLISNRGCFGGCSFCALTFHQGRIIQTRSHESLLEEAKQMTQDPDFKGYIHDVGGPTANFRHPSCEKQLTIRCLQEQAVSVPDTMQES